MATPSETNPGRGASETRGSVSPTPDPRPPTPAQPSHREGIVEGLRLHWVELGEGPPVLLLHGFPDFWYAWRHQLPALAAAGFRAVAPDLRGYNRSEKPPGVGSYRVGRLAGDMAGLIRALGAERAAVVGHDWGGVVAWHLAMHRPEVVERLAVLNAPHPAAFLRELRTPGQMLRSAYAGFFQLPWLPEAVLRAGNFALLRRALRAETTRADAFPDGELARYVEAWSQPGALSAMLAYYRAAGRGGLRRQGRRARPVRAPTLLLWGERDPHLRVELTEGLEPWVRELRVERIAEAGHWVMIDAHAHVNRRLVEFLRGGSTPITRRTVSAGSDIAS